MLLKHWNRSSFTKLRNKNCAVLFKDTCQTICLQGVPFSTLCWTVFHRTLSSVLYDIYMLFQPVRFHCPVFVSTLATQIFLRSVYLTWMGIPYICKIFLQNTHKNCQMDKNSWMEIAKIIQQSMLNEQYFAHALGMSRDYPGLVDLLLRTEFGRQWVVVWCQFMSKYGWKVFFVIKLANYASVSKYMFKMLFDGKLKKVTFPTFLLLYLKAKHIQEMTSLLFASKLT